MVLKKSQNKYFSKSTDAVIYNVCIFPQLFASGILCGWMAKYYCRLHNLRTLDLSKNNIQNLGKIQQLKELKSFNCDENALATRSLIPISKLAKLTSLSLGKNRLENASNQTFPEIPAKVKTLKLNNNSFSSLPKQICDPKLALEKLDLSFNNLAAIPAEISNLGEYRVVHLLVFVCLHFAFAY